AIERAGKKMLELGAKNVLIKGGHAAHGDGHARKAVDHLFTGDGCVQRFESEYLDTGATHGTGCTLAAAIAANLALGKSVSDAVEIGKAFVFEAIRTAPKLGGGSSPVNIPAIWPPE
ncbi:MAG TPA: bifunctional hydroxymethylpyrimidine kinase/phosphomethylpyrimidine kinase, partial [Pyrinomonadaceae bacterium]|nr:bifunctional hydroxymethylpyrimidine kinase/phosphomethylpyrimidine kinase [Pyrinomonadaceae bacterium]